MLKNKVIHNPGGFKAVWNHRIFYLFLVPAIITLFLFAYRSYLWIVIAFQDYDLVKGIGESAFVGFQNFIKVFSNRNFPRVLKNTLGINFLGFLFGFPAPIIFALLLNEIRLKKFKRTVQTLTYLPHFLSWVVVAGLFYVILDEDLGIINSILNALGFAKIAFLREAKYFWGLLISLTIWKEIGWGAIIYLAALTSIDASLYEAARVDGASRWAQVKHITIPGILPTIAVMLILTSGKIATGGGIVPGFDAILNLQNPMVYDASETLQVFNYSQGILYSRYSFAQALDLVQSLVAFVIVFGANYGAKKIKGYGVF